MAVTQTPLGYGLGFKPQTRDTRDFLYAAPYSLLKALPPIVDLGPKCPARPVQNASGSCTGNGGAFGFDYLRMSEGLPPIGGSRYFLYWNERDLEGDTGQDAGAMIRDQMKALAQWGICPEADWPYDLSLMLQKPSTQAYNDAATDLLLQYAVVQQTAQQMMGCLADQKPFSIGFQVYQGYERPPANFIMPMPQHGEQSLGGHNNYVIGYDATRARYPETLYKFANWWNDPAHGQRWGDNGDIWVPESFLANPNYAQDFWVMDGSTMPAPTPIPSPTPDTFKIVGQGSRVWMELEAQVPAGTAVTWSVTGPDILELDPGSDAAHVWIAPKGATGGKVQVVATAADGSKGTTTVTIGRHYFTGMVLS